MRATATRGDGSPGLDDATGESLFRPQRGTIAYAVGGRMRGHPILTGSLGWIASFIVLAVVVVGLGLLFTHILAPEGGTRLDASVSHWFVQQRTPTLNTVTTDRLGPRARPARSLASRSVAVIVLGDRQALASDRVPRVRALARVHRVPDRHAARRPDPSDRASPRRHAADFELPVGPHGCVARALRRPRDLIWSLVRSTTIRAIAWIVAFAAARLRRRLAAVPRDAPPHRRDRERPPRLRRGAVRAARDPQRPSRHRRHATTRPVALPQLHRPLEVAS